MYSFLLFCKCIQTYVEFGLRVLHYGYITEILRTVPAAQHLQSQWKDDVLMFKQNREERERKTLISL